MAITRINRSARHLTPRMAATLGVLSASAALVAQAQDAPASPAPAEPSATVSTHTAPGYIISDKAFHDDPEVLWKGFLSGTRGFEGFANPVGNPIYFESPLNYTGIRLLFLHHEFSEDSVLGGGDLNVYAAQARLAITERLGFIATKDGYSDLNADVLPSDEGWNDIAIGAKYVLIKNVEKQFLLTIGGRWMWENGDAEVLQGGVQEISPFISVGKGFGRLNLIADMTYRIPFDSGDDGNEVFQWDVHADFQIAPAKLPGVFAIAEVHGLHYMSDGDRTPLPVGGLDYSNLGSTDVSGNSVVWLGFGTRVKFTPNTSMGATYEFPLTSADEDIMGDRFTVDFEITW
jgi:hypothetical protein